MSSTIDHSTNLLDLIIVHDLSFRQKPQISEVGVMEKNWSLLPRVGLLF